MAGDGQGGRRLTRVFISYADDAGPHAEAVRELCRCLRDGGLDVRLDWPQAERRDMTQWMLEQVRESDYVLVMASAEYRRRAEGEAGPGEGRGVQYEAALIREEVYRDRSRALRKFLPVLLGNAVADDIPIFLGPHSATHYHVAEPTTAGVRQLLRVLTGQRSEQEPLTILHVAGLRDLDPAAELRDVAPDLLVVSGDLAETGRRAEFERAGELLESLAARLGLEPGRVIIVPGERDVNRAACEAYFQDRAADDLEPEPPYWPKWRHFVELYRRFHDASVGFTPDQPWALHELPGARVVVAALNSTMRDSHRPEDHHGWVGPEQLRWFADRLRSRAAARWLRIGVVHHSVRPGPDPDGESLRDADELERRLAPHLDLLLHGHARYGRASRMAGGLLVLSTDRHQVIRMEAGSVTRLAGEDGRESWTTPPASRPRGVGVDRRRDERHRPDDFLERVAEVYRLRRPGAQLTRVEFAADGLAYLRVSEGDGTAARLHPVGGFAHGAGPDEVDRFQRVHDRYRQADPHVVSELVYGGERAPQDLIRDALRRGIRLVSFLEHQGVLDLRGYVQRVAQRLRADPRYPHDLYVSQRYRLLESGDRTVREDLLGTLLEWLRLPHGRFALVLGDFGTGKSFLMRELFRRVAAELPMTPVLVQIGALQRAGSFDALIANHLSEAGEETFDLPAFRYMLREGRIALLLDGYDELANRVTYDRAAEHLQTMLDGFEGRAKMVLTSRTQHFRSTEQVMTAIGARIAALPGRRLVQLERLEQPQIREFLGRLLSDDTAAERRFGLIRGVEDLVGLAENPRMLSFIAALEEERLVEVRERRGRISAAELYRLLLQQWLEGEYRRAQPPGSAPSLALEQRWAAATALALEMWPRPESALRLDQLTASVAAAVVQLPSTGMGADQATHAIGSGTLLVRDENDGFGFVHSSVMGWLVAASAAELATVGGEPAVLRQRKMSALMADFFCDLAGQEAAVGWARREIARADTDAGAANALLVLNRLDAHLRQEAALAGRSLRGADLSGRDLRDADLRGADLDDAVLVGANLRGATLTGARLRGSRLDRADLTGADLGEADLTGARLLGADLRGATLRGTVLRRAALIGARLDPDALDGADAWGAALDAGAIEPQFGDTGSPRSIAISRAGDLIVTGSDDGAVWLWDPGTGRPLRALAGHEGDVAGVAIGPDGRWLASAGADGTMRLWDAESGRPLRTPVDHPMAVRCVAISPDGRWLASAGADGVVRLWGSDGRGLPRFLAGQDAGVHGLAISPDGRWLATAADDGTVRTWDAERGQVARTLTGHDRARSVAIGPDGSWLVSTGTDGLMRLWDAESGRCLRTLETGAMASPVAISPDGSWLATAGAAGAVLVWEPDGRRLHELEGHRGGVTALACGPDGRWLASAGEDGAIRLWDADGGRLQRVLGGDRRELSSVAFGRRLWRGAAAGADGVVRVWEGSHGRPGPMLEGHGDWVTSVAISSDERWLAAAGADGTVRLWDAASGRLLHVLGGAGGWVRSVAIGPDGRWLASAGDDHLVRLWDAETGRLQRALEGHREAVRSLAIGPEGRLLASAGDDGAVRLWGARRLGGWHLVRVLDAHGPVTCVAFGRDAPLLAAAGADGAVRLWDPESGQPRRMLDGHRGGVRSVAVTADGFCLASAGADGRIKLWDPDSGRLLRTVEGHRGPVQSVAIDRRGRWLVSAGRDGSVRVWSLTTGNNHVIVPMADGSAYLLPDGSYRVDGVPAGELWYAAGLCRFEPGELDDHVPALRRLAADDPIPPP